MSKIFLPFVFVFNLLTGGPDTPFEQLTHRVTQSLVHVTGIMYHPADAVLAPYACTGFVVGDGLVLTAGHCVGGGLRVDDVPARQVKVSTVLVDLALLQAITDKPALLPAPNPLLGATVIAAGYAFGGAFPQYIPVIVVAVDATPDPDLMSPGLFVAGSYAQGMSGGPVVSLTGQVVGMIQQSQSGTGYGVGTQTISAFLAAGP